MHLGGDQVHFCSDQEVKWTFLFQIGPNCEFLLQMRGEGRKNSTMTNPTSEMSPLSEICLLIGATNNNKSISGIDDQSMITDSITPYTLIRPSGTSRSSRDQVVQCLKLRMTHRYRLGKTVPILGKYVATVSFA